MLNWKFGMDIGLEDLTWEVYCSWIDSEVGRLSIMEVFLRVENVFLDHVWRIGVCSTEFLSDVVFIWSGWINLTRLRKLEVCVCAAGAAQIISDRGDLFCLVLNPEVAWNWCIGYCLESWGFVEFGCVILLSDIWKIGSQDSRKHFAITRSALLERSCCNISSKVRLGLLNSHIAISS